MVFTGAASFESTCDFGATIFLSVATWCRFCEKVLLCHGGEHLVHTLFLFGFFQPEGMRDLAIIEVFVGLLVEKSDNVLQQIFV